MICSNYMKKYQKTYFSWSRDAELQFLHRKWVIVWSNISTRHALQTVQSSMQMWGMSLCLFGKVAALVWHFFIFFESDTVISFKTSLWLWQNILIFMIHRKQKNSDMVHLTPSWWCHTCSGTEALLDSIRLHSPLPTWITIAVLRVLRVKKQRLFILVA